MHIRPIKKLSKPGDVKILAKNNTPVKKEERGIKIWWNETREYFTNVYSEMKKVTWPGRAQLIGYTGVVLFAIALMALIIWVFDSGLSFALEKLFKAFA